MASMSDGRDNIAGRLGASDDVPFERDGHWPDQLGDEDRRAVDRLAEMGWRTESSGVTGSSGTAEFRHSGSGHRAQRVADLLSLLELGGAGAASDGLAERTLQSIRSAPLPALTGAPERDAAAADLELSVDDQEALDALMLAGFSARRVPSALRGRAQKIEAMADLVAHTPVANEVRPDLVEATTLAVLRTPKAVRSVEPSGWRGSGWRFADLVSVAAVLLIGTSVLWPVASSVRAHSLRTGCASNLASVATAMGTYAGDFGGQLPMATAGFGGGTWWNVGSGPGKSNSANLFTLARAQYATLTDLACGGNENAVRGRCGEGAQDWRSLSEISYSYQILDREAGDTATWSRQPDSIILADRSPVTLRAARGEAIYTLENSPNHDGRGQRVLRNDGSTVWLSSPEYLGDNIWLPGQLEALIAKAREMQRSGLKSGMIRGNELPVSPNDAFVGP